MRQLATIPRPQEEKKIPGRSPNHANYAAGELQACCSEENTRAMVVP